MTFFLSRAQYGAMAVLAMAAVSGCRSSTPDTRPAATAAPTPIVMTATQKLGVNLVTTFSQHPSLQGSRISVGTSADSITLDGVVRSQQQKNSAEWLAKQKAPGYKIVNRLTVDPKLPAPSPASATPHNKR